MTLLTIDVILIVIDEHQKKDNITNQGIPNISIRIFIS